MEDPVCLRGYEGGVGGDVGLEAGVEDGEALEGKALVGVCIGVGGADGEAWVGFEVWSLTYLRVTR